MSESMANSTAHYNQKYGTIELFESYWVHGIPSNKLTEGGVGDILNERGIPTRSQEDAMALRHGKVELHELWEDYLSDFQIRVARELKSLNLMEQQEMEVSNDW